MIQLYASSFQLLTTVCSLIDPYVHSVISIYYSFNLPSMHSSSFDTFITSLSQLYASSFQLLTTVCSLIDPYASSVKSGWRSVFAFVMAIRISERVSLEAVHTDHRLAQILGIFSAFLGNKNPAVFASAAVQCIHALLRFVNSSGYDDSDDGSRSDIDSASNLSDITPVEMSLPALEFLSNFSKKLASIYIMPSSLVFYGSHSVSLAKLGAEGAPLPEASPGSGTAKRSSELQEIYHESAQSIIAIDDTGVLRVWFLLLEGLTGAVAQCPRRFQPQTLEVLFEILRSITTVPGPSFSVYTVSHLLLPMLKAWVERGNRDRGYWEGTAANFKHACGLATELIVEELGQFLSVEGARHCHFQMLKEFFPCSRHLCASQVFMFEDEPHFTLRSCGKHNLCIRKTELAPRFCGVGT